MVLTPKEITRTRVDLRQPRAGDLAEYTALARRSRRFHAGLALPARTAADFEVVLRRSRADDYESRLLIRMDDDALLGAATLSQIFRGGFQNAYLGYWIGAPHANQGYMTEGLKLMLDEAFRELRLHRLEANIQPQNEASRRLVQKLGFRLEGYSPRYLKIGGRWRDHERWAILKEEWLHTHRRRGARNQKDPTTPRAAGASQR